MEVRVTVTLSANLQDEPKVSFSSELSSVEQNTFNDAVREEPMEWTAYGEQGPGCAAGSSVSSMDDNETPMEID